MARRDDSDGYDYSETRWQRHEGARQPAETRKGWNDTQGARGDAEMMADEYASYLEEQAIEQARRREPVSTRWFHDVEQYKGVYPEAVRRRLVQNRGESKLYVNLTRPKTRTLTARLIDILFPTDDLNFDMKARQVPALELVAEHRGEVVDEETEQAAMAARQEATRRVEMLKKIQIDQLKRAHFEDTGRKVIAQGCKLGIGVVKGPVPDDKPRKRWDRVKKRLIYEPSNEPTFRWVDAWNFFPDMDGTDLGNCDFTFELHRMSAREMRDLAKRKDFIADNIRDVLKQGPKYEAFTDYVADLRDVENEIIKSVETRYFVWEYHGPITAEKIEMLGKVHGKDQLIDVFGLGGEDPLDVAYGIIWFCQGRVLKFGPHPLDSGSPLYSVWRLDNDESALVSGDGVPSMMRDHQRAINSAWRLMMRNGALSGVPMFIVDRSIKPANGRLEIVAGKIWEREHAQEFAGIQAVDVSGNTQDLETIIGMAINFIDQETNLPLIASGDQSTEQTKTAHGMALLANAVNVIFRNATRSFDRDVIVPCMERLHEWNIQFSDNEAIKEDVEIEARGSSVLLVRDIQAQNLLMVLNLAATNPVLGQLLRIPTVARRLFQALQLSKDEMVLTDAELKQLQEQMQGQPDPEIEAKLAIENIKIEGQIALEEMRRETEMMKLSAQSGIKLEEIAARLEQTRMQSASRERLSAAEFSVKERLGTGI